MRLKTSNSSQDVAAGRNGHGDTYTKPKPNEYTNSDKLGVYAVKGMRYGLFAKQDFSIMDRFICVYHGKKSRVCKI